MTGPPGPDSALLAGDEELLVPRLVARIAELESQLYSTQLAGAGEEPGGLLDRFSQLLKKAQQGLDASVSFLVGEVEGEQRAAQEQQAAGAASSSSSRGGKAGAASQALTKEATAKALLITLRKLQQLKQDKAALEQQVQSIEAALSEAQAAAARAAALAAERDALQEEAQALSTAHREDQQALASVTLELERLRGAQQAVADQSSTLEAAGAAAAAAAASEAEALRAEAVAAARAACDLRQELAAAQARGEELEQQLQASREECAQLRRQLEGMGEAAEALAAEAEGLRAARATVAQELNETRVKLERARSDAEEFQRRFLQERLERRKVHEQLQVLRGNIRVLCRVRPLASPGEQLAVSFPYPGSIAVHPSDKRVQEFEFDGVFPQTSSQEGVFDEVAPLIRSCADGYNVCIFAYGQTGSGKTHTMMGPDADPGLSVRALQALFEITAREAQEGGALRTISVSMLEIYNEHVRDLLKAGAEALKPLEVSGLGAGQLVAGVERVPGLTWRSVASVADVLGVLAEGNRGRATAATALNAHSSRSHALLSVRLADATGEAPPCHLHLVDLAGSERIAKSEVAGQQLKEAQAINRSLSALGDVVAALQAKSGHVPYRNSKLTQVLQDSLCGSSKVLLVCCVSPEVASAQESLSSLNFASRAAQVELGPVKKVQDAALKKAAEAGGAGAGKGSPLTPVMSKSRLGSTGSGTPASGRRSVLREANANTTPL